MISTTGSLFPDKVLEPWRPIHYLGSKLRFLPEIVRAVQGVRSTEHPVCDLFAGSGTTAFGFAQVGPVTAVDIQEYSTVICNALLKSAGSSSIEPSVFLKRCAASPLLQVLLECLAPLIKYEHQVIRQAMEGQPQPLCDFLDHGSIYQAMNEREAAGAPSLQKAINDSISNLEKCNLSNAKSTLATRYFGGVYFSFDQSVHLDAILEEVFQLAGAERASFLAPALSTASDVVNTVGKQFAQPIRPKSKKGTSKPRLAEMIARDRFRDVLATYADWVRRYAGLPVPVYRHEVIKADYADFLRNANEPYSVIYADPPYTRDHYSRYYHVLETLCLRDNPSVSSSCLGPRPSRGIYRDNRHQSPFCIKSKATDAFATLLGRVAELKIPLVLSYSPYSTAARGRPRLLTFPELKTICLRYFRNVQTRPAGNFQHSKLNRTEVNAQVRCDAEYLFICTGKRD